MKRVLSQIGYIMKILNISVNELAQYLHIDRTTISKWKSGSRILNKKSPYYNEIINYFILKDNEYNYKPLYSFFKTIYRDLDYNDQTFLKDCIERYLYSNDVTNNIRNYVENSKNVLYQINVPIFKGVNGRKNVINIMLNIIESSYELCEVKILELGQVEWLTKDITFVKNFIKRLDDLSRKGHKLELSYSIPKNSYESRIFFNIISVFNFNKNVAINIIDDEYILGIVPCIYSILGKFVATSFNYEKSICNIHTMIFLDKFTIDKYISIYKKITKTYSKPMVLTNKNSEKDKILQLMKYTSAEKESIYFFGKYLSIATMSESLLLEILEQNNVSKAGTERCLSFYKILQVIIKNTPTNKFGGLYINLNSLEEAISYDYIIQYELSIFCEKQILQTKEQFYRHLSETADIISNNKHMKVVLNLGYNTLYMNNDSYSWIKHDKWCLVINSNCDFNNDISENQLIFFNDISLVRIASNICEQNYCPLAFKDVDYIISVLKKLSQGHRI